MEDINKLCPMTEEEKAKCIFKDSYGYREPLGVFDRTRRVVAEISFKAGIQEVVDFIQQDERCFRNNYYMRWKIDLEEWQEQKRKWGI